MSLFTQAQALQERLLADAFTPWGRSPEWQEECRLYLDLIRQLNAGPVLEVSERERWLFRSGHALLGGWVRGRLFG